MAALLSFADRDDRGTGARPAGSRRLPRVARVRVSGGETVCDRCEIAESVFARMRGLLGRSELPAGHGMLINPAPSVMTYFMRFPIDVVFLDRDWRVVKVVERLVPWRVAGARHAVAALELAAGAAEACGLQVGDVLELPAIRD
jgi:uncharacterized membrane protein (UPF0127 family)